jgi:hypothetical protein
MPVEAILCIVPDGVTGRRLFGPVRADVREPGHSTPLFVDVLPVGAAEEAP